jgi:hypothetical protein
MTYVRNVLCGDAHIRTVREPVPCLRLPPGRLMGGPVRMQTGFVHRKAYLIAKAN